MVRVVSRSVTGPRRDPYAVLGLSAQQDGTEFGPRSRLRDPTGRDPGAAGRRRRASGWCRSQSREAHAVCISEPSGIANKKDWRSEAGSDGYGLVDSDSRPLGSARADETAEVASPTFVKMLEAIRVGNRHPHGKHGGNGTRRIFSTMNP
jgi:hypothetical protein